MIYLDNAATTKPNKEVIKTIEKLYHDYFLNADSPYLLAVQINEMQEKARSLLADLLKVKDSELIYTSCGSEANNMAVKGIAFKYLNKGKKHIITSKIEHSSIYETMKQLENFGFEVTYLLPDKNGVIANDDILSAIKDNTILISVMKVNSEIGSINNVEKVYDKIKEINKNIIVHCDCVQALGKYALDLNKMDLASFAAHKINGVKGSGLLYKKSNISILPLISGGQQEFDLRAGTSNYYYNIVLTKTLRLFLERKSEVEIEKRYQFIYDLLSKDKRIVINSNIETNSKYILNFSIPNYKAEVILNALERESILFSTKSACSSNVKRSRVIDALPIEDVLKDSSFRISFDLETTIEELQLFYDALNKCLSNIERG